MGFFEFTFQSFWHFCGMMLLIIVFAAVVESVAESVINSVKDKKWKE